jgi:hypothetical protein
MQYGVVFPSPEIAADPAMIRDMLRPLRVWDMSIC